MDDVKPGVTDMEEVKLCIRECDKLEGASGIRLHKNPEAGKIKLLPLGSGREHLNKNIFHSILSKLMTFWIVLG